MLGPLIQQLREFVEANTKGTLGHFRSHAGPGDTKNPRWRRMSKVGRKHAAQHAMGHHKHAGDVHDTHGGQHIHKAKKTKTGVSYSGKRVATPKLRKGATRHLAARSRLARMKWRAHSQKTNWVKKQAAKKAA